MSPKHREAEGYNKAQKLALLGGNKSPGGGSGGSGSTTYPVKAGDTLGNIGFANGTTATAIGAANGIQNLNLIRPGQVLTFSRR